jgi:16S rRNA (adenine1518-N6/adenine1519-N6)-dimethyltransferase
MPPKPKAIAAPSPPTDGSSMYRKGRSDDPFGTSTERPHRVAGASVAAVEDVAGGDGARAGARLLGPADIRRIAERLGIRPSKRLGQNFVTDAGTVRRIVALAGLRPDDVVLEVGPGFGSLTLPLLAAAARVIAVEIDPALAAELPRTVADRAPGLAGRLEVVTADAARVRDLPGEPTALVANLPYNVAVPVVLHLLATLPSLHRGLVMVQAEVADRMSAPPGSRTYGVPSVKLAWYADVRRAGPVPRTVFWPVPRVDSGLVAFTRRDPPPGRASREQVFAVVDAAFAQRRKTLRAALAPWAGSPAAAEQVLREAGVDPALRGESLGVAEFARIAASAGEPG